jgi:hypothetical protein
MLYRALNLDTLFNTVKQRSMNWIQVPKDSVQCQVLVNTEPVDSIRGEEFLSKAERLFKTFGIISF